MVSNGMASRSVLQPPQLFIISKPDEWPKWILRFECFRDASGLDRKEETKQIRILIYSIRDEVEDILQFFRLTVEE